MYNSCGMTTFQCFGFFDEWDLDFRNMKEFFKKKNKKNIKEFQVYIKEKYDNIVPLYTGKILKWKYSSI